MEYINKEDVLGKLYLDHKDVTYIDKNAAAERIKKIQSIDIVRCGECKHWRTYETWSECERWTDDPYESAKTKADDFCSYGERREP